jgi:hypothetical protein
VTVVIVSIQSEVMFTPGAKMSTQLPQLENDARRPAMSVAATVSAAGTRPGEKLHALALLEPATTA